MHLRGKGMLNNWHSSCDRVKVADVPGGFMATAEKQRVTLEIDGFEFVDEGADGVFSLEDSVICSDASPDCSERETLMLSASSFSDLVKSQGALPEILGMSYDQLGWCLKEYVSNAESLRGLLRQPRTFDEAMMRSGVKPAGDQYVGFRLKIPGEGSYDISVKADFVIPAGDIGARLFFAANGYQLIRQQPDAEILLAVRDGELFTETLSHDEIDAVEMEISLRGVAKFERAA